MTRSIKLNQVTIGATNTAESITFYKKLGLKLIVDSAPRYVRFEFPRDDGGEPDTLSLHAVAEGWKPQAEGPLIYFEVDDVAAFLKDSGVTPFKPAALKSYLWTEADIRDPSGNHIRVYNAGDYRRFPPWRVER